eukprot:TRINITY_DN5930_c0_g1_i1.p1 TRINITY_DN5930_c0_g1~~TRINITY_DN5930_c0_g1_i1.p1  ORF type:complete len:288 (-),score=57.85 TRINITY_DN5930_c0_g1_i1:327-1190(-)
MKGLMCFRCIARRCVTFLPRCYLSTQTPSPNAPFVRFPVSSLPPEQQRQLQQQQQQQQEGGGALQQQPYQADVPANIESYVKAVEYARSCAYVLVDIKTPHLLEHTERVLQQSKNVIIAHTEEYKKGELTNEQLAALNKEFQEMVNQNNPDPTSVLPPIAAEHILALAKKYNYTRGKWFSRSSESLRPSFCTQIFRQMLTNPEYPIRAVKVSSSMIEFVTRNYNDEADVRKSLDAIHQGLGSYAMLSYKPEIYTALRIYKGNPWNISASTYRMFSNRKLTRPRYRYD